MKHEQHQSRKIVMLAYENAQILDIAGPLEMFAAANVLMERAGHEGPAPYDIILQAEASGPVMTTGGLALVAHEDYAVLHKDVDTVIVSGGDGTGAAMRNASLVGAIKRHAKNARRIVSICSGSFLLAEAGLLEGRRATTHWGAVAAFRKFFPDVELEEDAIYVKDGNVWTSAGITAGMDLALALIADDLGAEMALEVARKNVIFMMRPGGQSQFSSHLRAATNSSGPIGKVMTFVLANLRSDCTVPELSEIAIMSERTFLRRFKEETGMTPAKFVEMARLESARYRLESTEEQIDSIASVCGFGSAERMRRAFQRQLGVAPAQYRERFKIPDLKEEMT